jgi:hypothetical protein
MADKAKKPATKEKLRSIMEAASALTALGDEESAVGSPPSTPANSHKHELIEGEKKEGTPAKRYIPEHKKPDAALTFPEKVSFHHGARSFATLT